MAYLARVLLWVCGVVGRAYSTCCLLLLGFLVCRIACDRLAYVRPALYLVGGVFLYSGCYTAWTVYVHGVIIVFFFCCVVFVSFVLFLFFFFFC